MKLDLNKFKFIFAVLLFLGVEPLISKTHSDGFCKSQRSIENQPTWIGWGNSLDQHRFQDESVSLINLENISNLKMKWVFGVPDAEKVRSQPSIAGGFLYFGTQSGLVYALDADVGCIRWTYKAKAEVRNAIAIDLNQSNHPNDLYFGDFEGRIYRLDALTGEEKWIRNQIHIH